jgi:hypothetical protein
VLPAATRCRGLRDRGRRQSRMVHVICPHNHPCRAQYAVRSWATRAVYQRLLAAFVDFAFGLAFAVFVLMRGLAAEGDFGRAAGLATAFAFVFVLVLVLALLPALVLAPVPAFPSLRALPAESRLGDTSARLADCWPSAV